ncbi:MAG: HNH endonuclease, partial [Gemmatimonadaceae bacterium]
GPAPDGGHEDLGRYKGLRRRRDKKGYIRVGKNGSEHRLVMEEMLGRKLSAGEQVRHRNGNRADNRPENLQLISQSERVAQHNRLAAKRKKKVRSAREQATMDARLNERAEGARARAAAFVAALRDGQGPDGPGDAA